MGVMSVEEEIKCSVSPKRLFKAFVIDADEFMPKILPNFFKSFQTLEGDGGVGSIKLVTFSADLGGKMKAAKHKIEEVDEEKHVFKYRLIEGGILGEDIEFVSYVYKFEEGVDGSGCTIKISATYHPKSDDHINGIKEKIERSKEVTKGFINAIEAHLHAHTNDYN